MLTAIAVLIHALWAAPPVISNIRVSDIGHSSFRVVWDTDVAPDNQRIQWGASTGALTREHYTYSPRYSASDQMLQVTGLVHGVDSNSSRVVFFKVASYNADGWGESSEQTVTLSAMPAVHPAPPVAPTTFQISEPSPSGCTTQTVSNLANLQSAVDTAVTNQVTACQIIEIAAGLADGVNIVVPPPANIDRVSASTGVNTGTDTITITATIKQSYSNGTRVRVGGDGWNGDAIAGGLIEGIDYYVINYSAGSFQLSLTPGGTAVNLTSTGSGNWMISNYPYPTTNWIQLRSALTSLTPDGVQVTSQVRPANAPQLYPGSLGRTGTYTLQFRAFPHHWYIGPGLYFNVEDSNQDDTTDPKPWPGWISLPVSSSYIAIQRNWFNGGGYPERINRPMLPEGSYIDFSDNYQENIDWWRPVRTGLALTNGAASITMALGTFNTGIGNCTLPGGQTVNFTGSATGTIYATIRPSDCARYYTLPAGLTCTNCTASTTGTDWPKNGDGRYSHGLVGTCAISSGTISSCTMTDTGNFSVDQYESWTGHIISYGPGPHRIANNYMESHGIFWHLDDSSTINELMSRDVVFKRNIFATPAKYLYGSVGSNGFEYKNRNQWECKRCERVILEGNEFYGNFGDVNTGPSIIINSNANFVPQPTSSTAGDLLILSNLIHDASGGIQLGGGPPGSTNVPALGRRMSARNNLLYNIDGWVYYNPLVRSNTLGYCFLMTHGGEDFTFDHNTCFNAGGSFPTAYLPVSLMVEGLSFTSNLFYVHDDADKKLVGIDWGSYGTSVPNCGILIAYAGLDCWGNAAQTFLGNVLVRGYTNSQTMSGNSASMAADWSVATNWIPADATVTARVTSLGIQSVSTNTFKYTSTSPLLAGGLYPGADGTNVGVDYDSLLDSLGRITNIRALSITTTGATIAFHSPDVSKSCYIAYGTGAPTTWAKTAANTSANKERTIALTGLSGATTYNYQVWCSESAPSSTQTFVTK